MSTRPSRWASSAADSEFGDAALCAVERDVDGVGIAGDIGVDRPSAGTQTLHAVEVVLALPAHVSTGDPHAVVIVHRHDCGWRGVGFVIEELK